LVLPVEEEKSSEEQKPLMLLALNSTGAIEWEELKTKVKSIQLHRKRIHSMADTG
jgi:hypothetical protein